MKASPQVKPRLRPNNVYADVLSTIGQTPLIELSSGFAPEVRCKIFLKAEFFNPGGSVKDRVALHMVNQAEAQGRLRPQGTIVECTSGNTGVGLAMVAAARGYRCILVVTDKVSREKVDLLRGLNAEVVFAPSNRQRDDPDHPQQVAARMAARIPRAWHADQYSNPANPEAHYLSTGPELWGQLQGHLDVFVAGCGTGGTLTGIGRYLKEQDPRIQVVAVDPEGSALGAIWRSGRNSPTRPYLVEGVGETYAPPTWDPEVIDNYAEIGDGEAFHFTKRLAEEAGLFVGGSSGMALAAALQLAPDLSADQVMVVLLPDTGERYLSKNFNPDWLQAHGLGPTRSLADATVADLLPHKPRVRVRPEDDLSCAWQHIHLHGVRPLIVAAPSPIGKADRHEVVGIVDEDRLFRWLLTGRDLCRGKVKDVLAPPPPVVQARDSWETLRKLLEKHHCVLVQDEDDWIGIERRDLWGTLKQLQP